MGVKKDMGSRGNITTLDKTSGGWMSEEEGYWG